MQATVEVLINATREKVWRIITDIEGSAHTIRGIDEIEVLERPPDSFVGFKWKETRTLFGRTATEIMWITDSVENEHYTTGAESNGAVYSTKLVLDDVDGKTRLTMSFKGEPQGLVAKIMFAITGPFFSNSTKKALVQDLEDIKVAAEQG